MINVLIIDNSEEIKPVSFSTVANIALYTDDVRALNEVEKKQPSVVLLNYVVRKEETVEYIELILKASTDSKIVVVAEALSQEKILNCLTAGAKGYQEIKQLDFYADKIIKVMDAGEAWITRCMVAVLLDTLRR